MIRAWRMVREARAGEAFTGEGARQFGGRWNFPGTPIVYTSEHQSLAALETLVHLVPRGSFRYAILAVDFEEGLVERLLAATLPARWRTEPPDATTMHIGSDWVRSLRTAVLAVPSVLIPQETNYLLNPFHPTFGQIRVQAPIEFTFDPRLLG